MDVNQLAKSLHPLEVKVLRSFEPGVDISARSLEERLGYKTGQANQAFSWLCAKGLARESGRESALFYELTDFGKDAAEKGTVEERLCRLLGEKGPLSLPQIVEALGIEQKDAGSAFGALSKDGALSMDGEKRAVLNKEWFTQGHAAGGKKPRMALVRDLLTKAVSSGGTLSELELSPEEKALADTVAKKRGAGDSYFRAADRELVRYALDTLCAQVNAELESLGISGEELGRLTGAMLERGTWKDATFRPYNISVPPARLVPGRRNPYAQFVEQVKDKLCSLGFEEFDGSIVQTEFWNGDALFMPQFHSARDIHDVYYVKSPTQAKSIEEPFLSNVAAAHENGGSTQSRGWGYQFDRNFTKRLLLRSQGTVLSARKLHEAKVPGKYFGIARCFRYDKVDATHLADFYQTEGIVLGDEVNLRTLLGFLKMFATEVAGAKEVKYVPGYFPFTEPSVEVHIKHPVLGWFELGGAGIFRPEVTEPMGVKVPVLAWGLGIDRMAMMTLGIKDIRELFSYDIESVRLRRNAATLD
jgi:phenylalanyl-tRNA synthetase alpha chain